MDKPKEIHEKSPVETVQEFFFWMYKKAKADNEVIYGRVDNVVYDIGPDPESFVKAVEKFIDSAKSQVPVL